MTPKFSRNCEPDSLDENKVKGKIVVCENTDLEDYSPQSKLMEVISLGGIGVILISSDESNAPSIYGFPMTAVSWEDGDEIISCINSAKLINLKFMSLK